MNRMHSSSSRIVLLTLVGVMSIASATASGQEVKATIAIEAAGTPPMRMDYWMGARSVRIDMAQPERVSIVWTSGAAPTMLMIQHGERRYMEWGEQELRMMRQMMQRVPRAAAGDAPSLNLDGVRFEPTGQTETIGPWSARGVRMTGREQGQELMIWIAPDLDVGLFELFARMRDALEAMQMPMFGGGGAQSQLARYIGLKRAAGLPAGGVVRVNAADPHGATTITLQSIEKGSFGEEPFRAPTGYEKVQMPTMPRF